MFEENNVTENNRDFNKILGELYLAYALSTITSRSLPDVRDGLKPVHRRILYAMLQLKLDPNSGYKKCARVVGDVIGKYHPHGDVAVYDTLVRMAQGFSMRYPLIEGQGNFGSIDGDNAAAMRYTESRLTQAALALMQDIDKDTVDLKKTYDDSELEPSLLPASFPNILANGAEGIAVGMATSIPPHNISELCDALIYLIKNPDSEIKDLLKFIAGPDFPTGGVIIDDFEAITKAYEIGRGSFRIRSKWHVESLDRGSYNIIITEIPYQVQKSRIIEQIADLLKDRKVPLLSNIRDESTDEIRIVIEPKSRTCEAEIIMEILFRQTDLESRFYLNLNVLNSMGLPKVMNLKEVLSEFLDHRFKIVVRRSKFEIEKISYRLEILSGLKIAYLNLDKIIEIIREEDAPKEVMMQKFSLTDVQAESILNTKLRSLRKLEEKQIYKEINNLILEKDRLNDILQNPKQCWKVINNEIKKVKEQFDITTSLGRRMTKFQKVEKLVSPINPETLIEKEAITIICSQMGWMRSIKGHNIDLASIKYKEGDGQKFILKAYTTDKVILSTSKGKFFTILADNIIKSKGPGEHVKLILNLSTEEEIANILIFKPKENILVASSSGKGFIINIEDVVAQTKLGKQILKLKDGHKCIKSVIVNGDMVACIGQNRKLLIFPVNEIPYMKKGYGVTLQKFKTCHLSDIRIFNARDGLDWYIDSCQKVEKNIKLWISKIGEVGKIPPPSLPKDNKFTSLN